MHNAGSYFHIIQGTVYMYVGVCACACVCSICTMLELIMYA